MNNKKDREEDINILKKLKETLYENAEFMRKENKTFYEELINIYIKRVQALENILADREKYKQLYERALSDLVSAEKENERLKTKYEANNSKTLLTAENLKELEEHCKRQVQRYETNKKMKEEHLLILELLYSYNQNEAKANKYDSLVENIKKDLIKLQEEYETLLEHQSGQESNRTKYLRGKIHMCQELLDTEKEKI